MSWLLDNLHLNWMSWYCDQYYILLFICIILLLLIWLNVTFKLKIWCLLFYLWFNIIVSIYISFTITKWHFLWFLLFLWRLWLLIRQHFIELLFYLLYYFNLMASLYSHLIESFPCHIYINKYLHLKLSRSVMSSSLNLFRY